MTDKLRALCEEALDLNERANSGPWLKIESGAKDGSNSIGYKDSNVSSLLWMNLDLTQEDTDLIASYRTSAPQLARELLKALKVVEAASKYMSKYGDVIGEDNILNQELHKALAEFEGNVK